jgi:hypothetical protein
VIEEEEEEEDIKVIKMKNAVPVVADQTKHPNNPLQRCTNLA